MRTIKKLTTMFLCLMVTAYTVPSFAYTAQTAVKTALSDAALESAVGGVGSLDATLANDLKDGSPVTAVVSNRTNGDAAYALESTNATGGNVITLTSGTLVPGESKVISGTPPAGRIGCCWVVRARVFIPEIAGQMVQDASLLAW